MSIYEGQHKTHPRRLQQCRINQQKYRAQATAAMERLHNQVQSLLTETARLQGRLEWLHQAPTRGTVVARAFFAAFRHGLDGATAFVQTRMSPTLRFQGTGDLTAFVDHWRRYAQLEMTARAIEAVFLDETSGELLHCIGQLRLHLDAKSVQGIFPSLPLTSAAYTSLVTATLELPLVVRLIVHDDVVTAVDVDIGWASCVVRRLASAADAADVLLDVVRP
ncbi:hypothetical protein SDRG_03729 [Saprolegnia diclina VS20]|uniref:Bzip transcription factor n=1 Tax=Saprolegnia diclina (strain VS20) TaxID=1156394 RepID=T0QXH8_SAPDV|nr:hypothetical protein SDRG_03729 [Saprolegnia diclina VS20]EQC38770.1 hypothetical protein SDRG_03729 [Saprolegnia diclina VS20]|eukprot:XP_008607594.1 hypothetical protein SDRG_03729 [Saprolegnia diclina VS20]